MQSSGKQETALENGLKMWAGYNHWQKGTRRRDFDLEIKRLNALAKRWAPSAPRPPPSIPRLVRAVLFVLRRIVGLSGVLREDPPLGGV